MTPRSLVLTLCTVLAFVSVPGRAAEIAPVDATREVENLAAFARVYGYVRFFYPGDAATEVDWDRLAILGAEEVRPAPDDAALRGALLRIFRPVAPGLVLSETPASPAEARRAQPGGRVTFWQYVGVSLKAQPGPYPIYQQRRVVTGAKLKDRLPLFEPADAPAPVTRQLTPGLALTLPTVLPVNPDGTTADGRDDGLGALQSRLAAYDLASANAADWRVRVGGVVTVWNVFQHFHPYLDGAGVRWEETLRPALRRALGDATAEDYHATLMEMIAASGDGHGYVYGPGASVGGLPMHVILAENQIVVVGTADEAPLRKGDIIRRLDGVDAAEILQKLEHGTPGSPHLRRFRALNRFGEGRTDRVARVEIERDGVGQVVELTRLAKHRGYFFNGIGEFDVPGFAEVRPGIYCVNLYAITPGEYQALLPQLAAARGVIFDWRWHGRGAVKPDMKMLKPHADIIPHLIDRPIQASPMLTPTITAPDRAGWSCREGAWPVAPKAPRFQGRVVFINEPSVVSYGETCMAMIAHYRLATLVGTATAGCNGNANFIELPGGFRVMWTGMDVRRHDHTPFYGVGFGPDVPVARTVAGVKAGRDEFLEAAIAFLEGLAR